MRLVAHGRSFWWSENWAWNYFDFGIVLVALLEIATSFMFSSEESSGLSGLRVLRIIRITRLLRAVRIVRLMQFVRSLRDLIVSIMYTLQYLAWSCILFGVIIYVFGIIFTQAATDYLSEHEVSSEAGSQCSSTTA